MRQKIRTFLFLTTMAFFFAVQPSAKAGTISGHLQSSSGGSPIAYYWVSVLNYNSSTCNYSSTSVGNGTDSSGNFTITGVPAGSVLIRASGVSASNNYVPAFWDGGTGTLNCANATPVTVTATGTVSGINMTLQPGGTITGSFTDASTSAPIAGMTPIAYSNSSCNNTFGLGNTTSGADGSFTAYGIPPGTVYVRSWTSNSALNYIPAWWDALHGTANCANATALTVTAGGTTSGLDFRLDLGGTITGTVKNAADQAIAGLYVTAYNAAGSSLTQAQTNAEGVYTMTGVLAGTTLVWANGTSNSLNYISKWGDGGTGNAYRYLGQGRVVTAGGTTTQNFILDSGGTITGHIASHTGDPLVGIRVGAFPDTPLRSSSSTYSATTDSSGNFTLKGLPSSVYVQANAVTVGINEVSAFWNGTGASSDPFNARPIVVPVGTTVPSINMQLAQGGSISGRITNGTTGVAGVSLSAAVEGACGTWSASMATTDTDGNYTLIGVPTGNTHVRSSGGGYVRKWWNATGGDLDYNASGTISVTPGLTVNNIGMAVAAGGTVSGRMTDTVDNRLYGMTAHAYTDASCNTDSFDSAITDADGNYTLSGLPAGTVYLRADTSFKHANFKNLWWTSSGGADWCPSAQAVTVTTGGSAANRDFSLPHGGTITGNITATDGHPLACLRVRVPTEDPCPGHFTSYALTDYAGNYTWYGTPTGSVYVRVDSYQSSNPHYLKQLWDGNHGTSVCAQAIPISISSDQVVGGINMTLPPASATTPLLDILLNNP